jgi:hypothetical protein
MKNMTALETRLAKLDSNVQDSRRLGAPAFSEALECRRIPWRGLRAQGRMFTAALS